jgi:opacity protein-like surface antigen
MRTPFLLFAVTSLAGSTLAAQQPPKPAPLIVVGGLTGSGGVSGLQLGAEYSLRRESWLGFRLEAAGLLTPTHKSSSCFTLAELGCYQGSSRAAGLQLGLAAIVSPLPRGRVSPYVVAGAAAVQTWGSNQGEYLNPDGSRAQLVRPYSWNQGKVELVRGIGLRLRLGDRPFDLEYRKYGRHISAYTLGTSLRF